MYLPAHPPQRGYRLRGCGRATRCRKTCASPLPASAWLAWLGWVGRGAGPARASPTAPPLTPVAASPAAQIGLSCDSTVQVLICVEPDESRRDDLSLEGRVDLTDVKFVAFFEADLADKAPAPKAQHIEDMFPSKDACRLGPLHYTLANSAGSVARGDGKAALPVTGNRYASNNDIGDKAEGAGRCVCLQHNKCAAQQVRVFAAQRVCSTTTPAGWAAQHPNPAQPNHRCGICYVTSIYFRRV